MNDLVDRQAVLDIVMQYCPDDDGSCSKADVDIRDMLDDIENLHEIELDKVKQGHWIDTRILEIKECSEFRDQYTMPIIFVENIPHVYPYNFCPNCGSNNLENSIK